jgi:hypothetical protein
MTPTPRRFDEDGMSTITELTVAIALFAVILLVTTLVLQSLAQTADTTTRLSNSTTNVQLAIQQVEEYLSGAVAPNTAAASSGQAGSSKQYSISSSYPCWGSNQPVSGGGSLTVAETTAIIVAHDYDIEFCGYVPGSAAPHVPHVIRVYMTTPCNTELHTCTLALADYTKINTGFSACTTSTTSCTSYNTYTVTSTTKPSTVLTISNVQCDTYCYNALSLDGTSTGASNSAYNVANSAISCNDQTTTTCTSTATPPMFSYYASGGPTASGSGSASGAMNPSALPLMDVASSSTSVSNPTNLQAINSVLFDMTVAGTSAPGGNTTKRSPSTTVSDQIYFPSLLTTVTAPYAPINVTAASSASPKGVKVSWTVGYDGGLTIGTFTIIAYTNNGATEAGQTTVAASTASGSTTNPATGSNDYYIVTTLTSGTSYTFTVQATNSTTLNGNSVGGTSTASALTSPVTAP